MNSLKMKSLVIKVWAMLPEETHSDWVYKIVTGYRFRELFDITDEDIELIKQEQK